jgi:hypothetical protein
VIALLVVLGAACGSDDDDDGNAASSDRTTTTAVSGTTDEFADYIGLSVEEAEAKAEADGRPSRVVEEDGESLPVTMDFNEMRLNFTVEDGTVTKVRTG